MNITIDINGVLVEFDTHRIQQAIDNYPELSIIGDGQVNDTNVSNKAWYRTLERITAGLVADESSTNP